ncbi:MAG TPA: TrmH family RNA methyltransferase [Candidatus Saccharimonadales bacterium]
MTPRLIVVAHNIRSTHNVGAIFRTCEGFGVERLILSGYTPYPSTPQDSRLPHIREKITEQIHKTALGAEKLVPYEQHEDITTVLTSLRASGFQVVGLEQSPNSIPLPNFTPPKAVALLLGEEVQGIPPSLQQLCDDLLEIPMYGKKESFNVSVACGIALYALRAT